MDSRATHGSSGAGATVVTSQKVRPGRDEDYKRWQDKTNRTARGFDGFEGTELYPPGPGQENEWVVVFRFSRVDQLTTWLRSSARQELLDEGRPLFEAPPTQEVLSGGTPAEEPEGITAVISHEIRPGCEEPFLRWQEKTLKAQEKYPGFMGSELFRPVPGIQEHWVVVFRFDSREHLDHWLESDTRKKLLNEGGRYFTHYDVRKIGSPFSGWFRFGEGADQGIPPNWKQAMSVVLALYPTVMVLNLTVGVGLDDAGVPGYAALFIGNTLSVSILTWVLMPLVNRALAFWLLPGRAHTLRVHVAGAALVALCYGLLVLIFGLTT
ncbi:antibiotic biosynthesis monooxygenase [Streptomyces sp. NPDC048636]|uniref:antibiotic biosynthesis monooxygenase n=1 Tax=Streptomyces sp. NPDC048636 TaxID=3155762 RepID=UPI0034348974